MSDRGWGERLERDVLEPYRVLSAADPFYVAMSRGEIPVACVTRYVCDTLWAVRDFAAVARHLADTAPDWYRDLLTKVANEEADHQELLARAVNGMGAGAGEIIARHSSYNPTPLYSLWWEWVKEVAYHWRSSQLSPLARGRQ